MKGSSLGSVDVALNCQLPAMFSVTSVAGGVLAAVVSVGRGPLPHPQRRVRAKTSLKVLTTRFMDFPRFHYCALSVILLILLRERVSRCVACRGTAQNALESRGGIPSPLACQDLCQPCVVPSHRNLDSTVYRVAFADRVSRSE